MIRDELVRRGVLRDDEVLQPEPASVEQVVRVHDREYVDKLVQGRLSVLEEAILELPYSKALADASFLCAGGSIRAAREAMARGAGANLGGGFHHAFPDHGEGFCVFNDVAIAIRELQAARHIRRAAVIDVDVHQGNGTAAIFRDDPRCSRSRFTRRPTTRHQAAERSGRGRGDRREREDLSGGFGALGAADPRAALSRFRGVRRGRRSVPGRPAGAAQPDARRPEREGRYVFGECASRQIPFGVFLAGGYARDIKDTVGIQADMVEAAFHTVGSARSEPK